MARRLPKSQFPLTRLGGHGTFYGPPAYLLSTRIPASLGARGASKITKEQKMDGTIIGLVAVIMSLGIPLGATYTYYRVRKLRSEERLAAIAKGVSVPMEPELSQGPRSRRAATLLVTGALGYILTFGLIA